MATQKNTSEKFRESDVYLRQRRQSWQDNDVGMTGAHGRPPGNSAISGWHGDQQRHLQSQTNGLVVLNADDSSPEMGAAKKSRLKTSPAWKPSSIIWCQRQTRGGGQIGTSCDTLVSRVHGLAASHVAWLSATESDISDVLYMGQGVLYLICKKAQMKLGHFEVFNKKTCKNFVSTN